jgi:hypothetical protein
MTPQWLTRIIACHRAHTAVAGGDDVARAAQDVLAGATDVTVGQTAGGFSVSIRSDNARVGREIYGRARALVDAPVLTSAPSR